MNRKKLMNRRAYLIIQFLAQSERANRREFSKRAMLAMFENTRITEILTMGCAWEFQKL